MIGRMPFCSSEEIAGVLLRPLDDVRVEVRAMKAAGVVEVVVGGGVRGSPERMNLTRDGAEELARRRGCTMEQCYTSTIFAGCVSSFCRLCSLSDC